MCGVVPALYVEPANEDELARVMKYASQAGIRIAPRGGGTKLDWGTAPQAIDLMISTAKLTRILEHAPGDMTITVEAGATFSQLQSVLSPHRQRLALDPLWPSIATVGGVIAANDSGSLRLRYGGVRDLIIGITVVLSDGTIAKSGGKVVKNVAGYDLPKLMSGALGTLGIITKAVFRLHPLPESSRTLTFPFVDRETANQFMLSVTDSTAVPTGLQMRTGADGKVEVDVRIDGISAGIIAQTDIVCKLAASAKPMESETDPWQAREQLWKTGRIRNHLQAEYLAEPAQYNRRVHKRSTQRKCRVDPADAVNRTRLVASRFCRLRTNRRFHIGSARVYCTYRRNRSPAESTASVETKGRRLGKYWQRAAADEGDQGTV